MEAHVKPGPGSALLVIDVQNDFCHPDGVYGRAGSELSAITQMLPRLRDTVAAWRDGGGTVVHVRTEHSPASDSREWLGRGDGGLPRACRAGSWGAEAICVHPDEDEVEVVKSRYSGFYRTGLEDFLRAHLIEQVLVAGVLSNVCVETTIREGCLRDFRMVMIQDCCASYDEALHRAAVENVRLYFGSVVDSAAVLRAVTSGG
jgi:ureidoacrylate peracid hydrolase